MMKSTTHRWSPIVTAISILIIAEAITFLLAALLHVGVPIPLGFSEPQIIPAAVVEGLCGLLLAVSVYALFAGKAWARRMAIAAHIFAVAGVLLGIVVLSLRGSLSTEANTFYHRTILVVLIVTLVLLATPGARVISGYDRRTSQ